MGIILKTYHFQSSIAYSFLESSKNDIIPFRTWDAGTSPGCTQHVKKIVGLLNFQGLSREK